jgi:hypothetical protein
MPNTKFNSGFFKFQIIESRYEDNFSEAVLDTISFTQEWTPKKYKKEPGSNCLEPGIYLATTYSHKTYRLNTIGAAAFHFRVRNGTGWFHCALVTRSEA